MSDAAPVADQPPGAVSTTATARPALETGIGRAPRTLAPTALDPQRPIGIDRRSWLRLKRGQVRVEETVDLHGLTQDQAHARLTRFLAEAQSAGLRCVVVVTGKGLLTGGVLRHMVPRWLDEAGIRERVLAYAPAQPKHGGAGALNLLIRKKRVG
jgi:DNA-nicking Smr family endonuclease